LHLAAVGNDEDSSVENLQLGKMVLAGLSGCDWKSLITPK